jgi:hypothetical protein
MSILVRGSGRITFGRTLRAILSSEDQMKRFFAVWLVLLSLASCRDYEYRSKVGDQDGLVPPDQFARYGKEQAEAVAIAREYGARGDSALAYARGLPDVAEASADDQGHRLTIQFRSGWRVAVPPIADGKRGADTPGVGVAAGAAR